jgi:hypothetical protein
MMYTFQNAQGHVREFEYPIGEAPPYGATIDGGWTRVIDLPAFNSLAAKRHSRQRVKGWALPKNYPAAKNFDKDGVPVFNSDSEIRECIAKSQDSSMPLQYEAPGFNQT